ncbi:hypothetical protein CsatA_025569 [Cannabis sativa]
MKNEFEMSMVGELTFFLGLQVRQMEEGTFVSQMMQIGQAMLMIEKVQVEVVSFLEIIWFLGTVRNRIQFPCPQPRLSILLPVVVVLSYYG